MGVDTAVLQFCDLTEGDRRAPSCLCDEAAAARSQEKPDTRSAD